MMAPWLALTSFAAYDITALDEGRELREKTDTEKGANTGEDDFRRRERLQKKTVKICFNMFTNNNSPG